MWEEHYRQRGDVWRPRSGQDLGVSVLLHKGWSPETQGMGVITQGLVGLGGGVDFKDSGKLIWILSRDSAVWFMFHKVHCTVMGRTGGMYVAGRQEIMF